jgi:hypothetical protein
MCLMFGLRMPMFVGGRLCSVQDPEPAAVRQHDQL